MPRDTMIFHRQWLDALRQLPPEQRLAAYEALLDYAFSGDVPQDPITNALTLLMRSQIDTDQEYYSNVCEKRRQAIRKRWNKTKATTVHENTNDTNVFNCIHENTNDTNVFNCNNDNDNNIIKNNKPKGKKYWVYVPKLCMILL